MDNKDPIFFYEREYYSLSNFAAFAVEMKGTVYMTAEHAYHSEKFDDENLKELIKNARSAQEALRISRENRDKYRKDWDQVKVGVMKQILQEKVKQHPYIRTKLLESGERPLVEDSWSDSFWGWGPNKDGSNHLGKLWMEIREEMI